MTRWPSIMILLTALLSRAGEPDATLTLEGIKEFTAAYQQWDGKRFAAAAELFRRAASSSPTSSTNFYWQGAAEFHHALQLRSQPVANATKLAADAALNAALTALNTAVKLNERDAESHALMGTIYGMRIDGNFMRAIRLGPSVTKHFKKAVMCAPENPRVRYLLGTCQFHTAKKLEAQREALATLLKAEQLFEVESKLIAASLEPRWGRDTCLTFIGRTYERLGERAKAAEYFKKALALHPSHYLAADGLARVTRN